MNFYTQKENLKKSYGTIFYKRLKMCANSKIMLHIMSNHLIHEDICHCIVMHQKLNSLMLRHITTHMHITL